MLHANALIKDSSYVKRCHGKCERTKATVGAVRENTLERFCKSVTINDSVKLNGQVNPGTAVCSIRASAVITSENCTMKSKKINFDKEINPKESDSKKKSSVIANKNQEHEKVSNKSLGTISERKKSDSKRSKKRKKHMELLTGKKIKLEVTHQERSLNYLLKWKHSHNDWKFEKKKQIWLKNNMYDVNKVTDKFWNILVEYFSTAKGNIRKMVIEDALKIIEDNGSKDDDSDQRIINRARNILQYLQE
ncbi:hypothetical protein FQA39_LY14696 [Lamprigera yunnana]|nr:hypothetical protein FQA39_LY14696 [Lamprigera yunnana]